MNGAGSASFTLDLAPVLGRRVTVLGSTGSVGAATLDVIRATRERYGADAFPIEALTAQRSVALLAEQARAFRPRLAVVSDPAAGPALKEALAGTGIQVQAGEEAVLDAARLPAEIVMAAIVGAAGLRPTLAAVERGAIVALANKECVVAAPEVFRRAAKSSRAALIPVDSEHNAAFQLLDFRHLDAMEKLTLTASGGPFRNWPTERMAGATPEQAVSHPNWSMGAKISVDSATLMNKGLELIEAQALFGLPADALDVIIHPQSIVHCLVAYADGSLLAHLSFPDMRTPIAHALGWPRRIASPARRLDFGELMQLTFEKPDSSRFPCLELARHCLRIGGAAPTILNAANEVAVEHFLARRLGFLGIARTVERTLEAMTRDMRGPAPVTLDTVLALDQAARLTAREACRMEAA
jgi:1-deoxy-D-xylulose-5-phosphate reductoisomerase